MWKYKNFKTEKAARQWMKDNEHRYNMTLIFVENGFAVEYKPLYVINL